MDLNLRGKKVAVTGAAGSFGQTFVKDLVEHGAVVYAISVTQSKLDDLKKVCPSITPIQCDLSKWAESEQILQEKIPDDIDMLINNAGAAISETIDILTEEAVDTILNVNLKGTLCITKVVVNKMIARGQGGSIVNISSAASHFPTTFLLVYAMTKAGIDRLTKSLATQLGPHKIRVNSVNPSVVTETAMGDKVIDTEDKKALVAAFTPLPIASTTKDVSNTVMFLLSDKAKTITGQIMFVDSGIHGG